MANEISAIKVNNVNYSLRDSSKVEKNQAVTGATKCKITYDSKGLVTGGANLEASDIPSLGAGKITSGTFDTARIPSLAASKITSGTFDAARIPDLSSTYSVIGHNHDSSYITSVAAITSVSDRGCIEVTKNGSSTYIKVNGWDELVSSIPTKYAGSSSAGGAATSAAKLTNTSKIGDTNQPVYFTANGVPAAISYTIGTNVPSDAVFTDTNYYHTPSYSSGIKIATGTGRNDLYVPTGTAATNVAIGNHTHTITLASDSGTPTVTLSHNTTYKLTAGGNSVIFKTPSDNNTNYYHTPVYTSGGLKIGTGTGVSDMYVPNGSTTAAGVLQIGTSASNAAAGNHNHDSSYVAKNTAITGATKCKITYDSKGLVTSGANLEASDIPSLSAGKITSGTFDIARIPTGTGANQVAVGSHTHTISLATSSSTPTITLSNSATYALTAGGQTVIFKTPAGGGGGSTLYRHNIEMVVKEGSSTSGYQYYHCHFYTINSSSTAITHSVFYGDKGENYIKYSLQGGYVDDQSTDRYYGRSMTWLPRWAPRDDVQRELLIAIRDVYDSVAESYISAASAYSFIDTVEAL